MIGVGVGLAILLITMVMVNLELTKCDNCGCETELAEGTTICPKCGGDLTDVDVITPMEE